MEESNSEKIEYVRDAPLTDPQLDTLKRWPFAQRIAKSIESLSDPSSIVIGIQGAWGEGKTTVLNFIEQELEELPNVICIRFNPWQFQDETSLLLSFFQTLGDAVEGKASSNMRDKIRGVFDEYGALLSSISVGVGPVKFDPGQLYKELHALSYANIEKHKQKIENILKKGKKRIVIFMDDIDRMDKSEIQILFKLIKLTANFPYTVYVLALERGMVARALEERYPSGDFLEKIIQVQLQLPPADTASQLVSCMDGAKEILNNVKIQLTEQEFTDFENKFVGGLLRAIKTPRMVNRYINALAFSVPILKNEVNPIDLMLIEGMRIFYMKLYNSILDNRTFFWVLLGTHT